MTTIRETYEIAADQNPQPEHATPKTNIRLSDAQNPQPEHVAPKTSIWHSGAQNLQPEHVAAKTSIWLSSAQHLQTEHVAPKTSIWLADAATDLLFCCGGLLWILFAATQSLDGQQQQKFLATLMMVGYAFLSIPHFGATLIRAFTSNFDKVRRNILIGITVPIIPLAALCSSTAGIAIVLCKIYLFVVVLHYAAQNLAILNRYFAKARFELRSVDRLSLNALVYGIAASQIINQLRYPALNVENFLGIPMPFWGPLPDWTAMLSGIFTMLSAVIFSAGILINFTRQGVVFPMPAAILLLSTLGLFVITGESSRILWWLMPAFMHGTQSFILAMVEGFGKENSNDRLQAPLPMRVWNGLPYYLGMAFTGLFLIWGTPTLLALSTSFSQQTLGVVVAIVSFHHFIADILLESDARAI
ncbi:MAG TPA: hypothetical protein V6D17_01655 [Candidatus Obscuribacterales bacterium]